jgi:hypothetical protein
MTIVRNARRSKFVVVDKLTVEDKGISDKALGWLLRVLAKPEDWSVSIRQFAREYEVGLDRVRTAFVELEGAGYLLRLRYQTDRGTFDWEYRVFESKEDAKQARLELGDLVAEQKRSGGRRRATQGGQPRSGNPNTDAPCTDSPNTEQPNTDDPYTENPTTTKEGLSKDGPPKIVHQGPSGDPDGSSGHSSGRGEDLPYPPTGSRGAPSPHGGAPPPPSTEQNGHKPEKTSNGSNVAETPNAGVLMGEYLAACKVRPPSRFVGHLAKETRALLEEGIAPNYIRAALATVRKRGLHPSALASAVAQAMNADPPRINGRHAHADPGEELRRAREFNARQAARRTAAITTERGRQLAAEAARKGVNQ